MILTLFFSCRNVSTFLHSYRGRSRYKYRFKVAAHRVHRVATDTFWRAFHHDGKISPGWYGCGMHAHPLSLYLPSGTELWCMLQLRGQIHSPLFLFYPYMYSVVLPFHSQVFVKGWGAEIFMWKRKHLCKFPTNLFWNLHNSANFFSSYLQPTNVSRKIWPNLSYSVLHADLSTFFVAKRDKSVFVQQWHPAQILGKQAIW